MKTSESTNTTSLNNISENKNGNFVNLDSLIQNVKWEDQKNLRISKSFLWIYIVMALVYTGLFIINPDPGIKLIDRISFSFYIASMIAFAWIFKAGLKEYKNIDYSLPLIEMLRKVAKRYQLKAWKFLVLAIPILLMDAGLTISFYEDLLPMTPLDRILLVQVIYIPVMVTSGIIGYLIWRRKQKPLRDRALELIKELENE